MWTRSGREITHSPSPEERGEREEQEDQGDLERKRPVVAKSVSLSFSLLSLDPFAIGSFFRFLIVLRVIIVCG